jgi:hypothetical protein
MESGPPGFSLLSKRKLCSPDITYNVSPLLLKPLFRVLLSKCQFLFLYIIPSGLGKHTNTVTRLIIPLN